jgi:adenylate kinase
VTAKGLRVILIGAPGAGKGTQARKLSDEFGVPHIATGDMFRTAVSQGTPMGIAAKRFMDRGELVPDDVTVGIVEERLSGPDAAAGFVMDGFPRTVTQATAFDAILSRMGRRLDAAIEIAMPRDQLIQRLTQRRVCSKCQASYQLTSAPPKVAGICDRCGGELIQRDDDSEKTVAKRLDVYDRQTAPLLSYYKGSGLLKTVDGSQSIDAVNSAIVAATAARHEDKAS